MQHRGTHASTAWTHLSAPRDAHNPTSLLGSHVEQPHISQQNSRHLLWCAQVNPARNSRLYAKSLDELEEDEPSPMYSHRKVKD